MLDALSNQRGYTVVPKLMTKWVLTLRDFKVEMVAEWVIKLADLMCDLPTKDVSLHWAGRSGTKSHAWIPSR